MSVLNPAATKLLDKLTKSKSVLIDKPQVMQVVGFVRTLDEEVERTRWFAAFLYLAATGGVSAEAILKQQGLSEREKADLVHLTLVYQDAQKYRDLQAQHEGQLKRYQAFVYGQYDYGAGGSNDISAEADTLEALAEACPSTVRQIDEVLDMQARKWLDSEVLAALNGRVAALYAERNPPVQGPKTKEAAEMERAVLDMLTFAPSARPTTFGHEEIALTRGLHAAPTPVQDAQQV